jgi:hypothetical protein
MKPARRALAWLIAIPFLQLAPAGAADGDAARGGDGAVRQSFSASLGQEAFFQDLRSDSVLNGDNWLGLPDWGLPLDAQARWEIDIARRLSVSLEPSLRYLASGGTYADQGFAEAGSPRGAPGFSLDRAEARLSVREIGLEASFGKTRPQFGSNYLQPLSVINLRGREGCDQGLWMAGLFLALRDLSLEAYCQASRDPVVAVAAGALAGLSEFGVVYRREGGNGFGAWYRGQAGDGFIPYAEFMLRQDSSFLDVKGLPARDLGWNFDALAGLGWTPAEANLCAYLEYRFRQSGYDESDWDRLRSLAPPDQAAAFQDFPRLQSAAHSAGLHLMNASEIGGRLSWAATGVYLYPDGLYASARLSAKLLDQLSLACGIEYAACLAPDPGSSRSETAFFPFDWRLGLSGRWTINAKE